MQQPLLSARVRWGVELQFEERRDSLFLVTQATTLSLAAAQMSSLALSRSGEALAVSKLGTALYMGHSGYMVQDYAP